MSIIVSILSTFNNKGLKSAQQSALGLDKTLKRLGVTLGGVLSVRKIAQFGKASVKAFVEEDKAVKALALNLQNLGLSYDTTAIERYIKELQYASGVADSELRPAFQQLVSATRDITASQDLLGLALDVSAGSGKSLSQVVQALSRSYLGTNTALTRLNLGLSKAELKTKKFDDIAEDLSQRFSGQAARAVQTYAGKLAVLSAAAGDAQEILGEKLVQSVELLMDGKTGIPALAKSFEDTATFVGNTVLGFADFIKQVKTLNGLVESGPSAKDFIQGIPVIGSYILIFQEQGKKLAQQANKSNQTAIQHLKDLNVLSDKYVKKQKTITKELTTQEKLEKAKKALQKSGDLMNMEKIQIEAAKQGDLTEMDKLRLEYMSKRLELEDALALKEADRALALATQLSNLEKSITAFKPASPFDSWENAIARMQNGLYNLGISEKSYSKQSQGESRAMPELSVFGGAGFITPELETRNPTGVAQINITVSGTGGLDDQTKKAVVDAVVEASGTGVATNWFRTTGRSNMAI